MNTRNTRFGIRRRVVRRNATALAVSAMTLSLAACGVMDGAGSESGASPTKGDDITVGLLLPEKENARYEKFDFPIIEKKVAELTNGEGEVRYANAEGKAAEQGIQLDQMIDAEVDVLLLDAVDSEAIASGVQKAKDAGIPVIAYDRLAQGPIDAYVSFDNTLVGEVQGRALADELGSTPGSKIVMINGAPTDPNAAQFKAGAMAEFQDKVTVAKTYDTEDWSAANAGANMEAAITSVGLGEIAGVYAANDGIAGAVIEVLKAAGVSEVPPVTGQDAELAAVQRIVAGDQFMSVYKSYPEEANAAAEMAVALVQGRSIEFDALSRDKVDSPTTADIPAQLVPVTALTRKNIAETVIADEIYTVGEICTEKYREDCAEIGLK
ncbi:sugar ABC transporter substrate-binding protein [Streptomyces sp. CRN 30]|uniref:sugar ABC transporter substrate-binding protein n=1 Tax=Streptomyces sp. CRN 30 TaxID=3075613 RepID=UPI0039C0835E